MILSVDAIFLWLSMVNAAHIVSLQEEATRRWHEPAEMPAAANELDALVVEQHRANFDLWHEEDQARDPEASPEKIAGIKRAIDRLNQRRNDLMERIDRILLAGAGEQRAEEIARAAGEEHVERNQERLAVLKEQIEDLRDALDALWAEVMSGKRRFQLY